MRILLRLVVVALWGAIAAPALAAGAATTPNPTDAWNHTWNEVLWDLWIIGIVFSLAAIYMLVKYKAKSPNDVGSAKKLTFGAAMAWCLVPSAIFVADDFLLSAKGWSLWNIQRTVPENAIEIKVTGSQWDFTYEYPNGVEVSSTDRDPDADLKSDQIMDGDMVIPVGQPVVLRMTATDVIHSFGLTDYRLKEDLMPGRVTYLWFMAPEVKTSQVICVEFCGTSHSDMFNRVKAVPVADYEAWMEQKSSEAALKKKPSLAVRNTASLIEN